MSTATATAPPPPATGNESSSSSYPDLASPTDSVIEGEFGAMSAVEQESQRAEWKEELTRTEEEIATLRQVLVAKEATALGLKRRLGEWWFTLHWFTLPGLTLPWLTLPGFTLPGFTLPGFTLPGFTLPWVRFQ
jgi:hypothetical protein